MPLRVFARPFPYPQGFATPRLDSLDRGTFLLHPPGCDQFRVLIHYIVRPHDYALDAIAENSGYVKRYFLLTGPLFAAADLARFRALLPHPGTWPIGLTNPRAVIEPQQV